MIMFHVNLPGCKSYQDDSVSFLKDRKTLVNGASFVHKGPFEATHVGCDFMLDKVGSSFGCLGCLVRGKNSPNNGYIHDSAGCF